MAKRLGELLIEKGLLDEAQLQRALREQQRRRRRLGRVLVELGMLSEDLVIQVLGQQLQVPSVRLRPGMATLAALTLLDESVCRRHECIPLALQGEDGGERWLDVALADPTNAAVVARIASHAGCPVRCSIAGPRAILAAIDAAYGGRASQQGIPAVMVGDPIFAFDDKPGKRRPGAAADDRLRPDEDILDWEEPEVDTDSFDIDVEEPVSSGATGPGLPAVRSRLGRGAETGRPTAAPVAEPEGRSLTPTGPDLPAVPARRRAPPTSTSLSAARPSMTTTAGSAGTDGGSSAELAEVSARLVAVQGELADLGRRFERLLSALVDRGVLPAEPAAPASQRGAKAARAASEAASLNAAATAMAPDDAAVIVNTPTREERAVQGGAAQAGAQDSAADDGLAIPLAARRGARGQPLVVIDFGTSCSSVAVVANGRARALPLPGNRWDMPSVVAICEDGSATVGEAARELLATDPHNTVASPKRLLGRSFRDRALEPYLAQLGAAHSEGPDGQVVLHLRSWDYTVAEICSFVLKTLRNVAERQVGRTIEEAVFTVPVDFSEEQNAALTTAARLAGLSLAATIEEPVAAAMSNFGSPTFDGLVAVYDFGGGTFDFALVDVSSERLSVVTKAGDSWLGGDDFDDALAGEAANAFWRQHDIELRKQVVQWQRLRAAAEAAKRKLSTRIQATIRLPDVALTTRGKLALEYPVSRAFFKNAPAVDLIQRSFDACRAALDEAGVKTSDLNAVYLSGGTSCIPAVRSAVERFFGRPPETRVTPERAVLLGAAVYAAMRTQQ